MVSWWNLYGKPSSRISLLIQMIWPVFKKAHTEWFCCCTSPSILLHLSFMSVTLAAALLNCFIVSLFDCFLLGGLGVLLDVGCWMLDVLVFVFSALLDGGAGFWLASSVSQNSRTSNSNGSWGISLWRRSLRFWRESSIRRVRFWLVIWVVRSFNFSSDSWVRLSSRAGFDL